MIAKTLAAHYKWGENCDSWVFCDSNKLSVKLESMPVGAREKWHKHAVCEQFFFVLKGCATFYRGEEVFELGVYDGVEVPAGVAHFIWNKGDVELEFLVIGAPNLREDRVLL